MSNKYNLFVTKRNIIFHFCYRVSKRMLQRTDIFFFIGKKGESAMFEQDHLIQEIVNLRKFALRLTGSRSDADDLLQSTILRALEKKHLFTEGTSLFRWCSKIMFNIFASEYRRRTRFETQYDPEDHMEAWVSEPVQDAVADLAIVRRAMEGLSPAHRQVLFLVCLQDMHYDEVSRHLNIPVGTVRSRLSRARESLHMLLGARVPPVPAMAA